MAEPDDTQAKTARGRALLAAKLAVTTAALAWALTRAPLAELTASARRLSIGALLGGLLLTVGNLALAAARSRVVLAAYGAPAPPRYRSLLRLQWVGVFFNTVLPGNVGGDVLRAHAMRAAFEGGPNAYVVVLLERVFGLAGLLSLSATILWLHPIGGVVGLSRLAFVGVLAAACAAVAPLLARRAGEWLVARRVVGPLGALLARLPAAGRPSLLLLAFVLSIGTQLVVATTGLLLVLSIASYAPPFAVLALVPVAGVATYFPATIAGLGVREAAFVALLSQAGVAKADATVASFAMLGLQLAVALLGGGVHLTTRDDAS